MEHEILLEPHYSTTKTPGHLQPKPRDEHEWSEHLDGFSSLNAHSKSNKDHPVEICWDMFEIPILLILIAIISALSAFLTNMFVNYGNSWRWSLVKHVDSYESWVIYCIWCLFFSLLASFVTQTICKEASGSGLPEMKTILSGVIKPVLLSIRLIIAKIFGLSLSLIAGLSVGKEGPFVQISGAIADQLMRLPFFQHVRRQDTKRLEVIACACASGVCVTFGTAFGGVLFSIEFTSSAYLVKTLPKAFLTAAVAMIIIYWLGVTEKIELFDEEIQTKNLSPTFRELIAFVCIGIISGLLGVLFVTIVEFISSLRNKWLDSTKYSRSIVSFRSYLMIAFVSLLTSIPMYYELSTFPFFNNTNGANKTIMDTLFQKSDLTDISTLLIPYFIYKFLATAVSVTLPLPVGLFTPVFLTGGILGRIIGEKICELPMFDNYFPWEYSLLAAAGLATGVTRAISTAVIVYELAGKSHLRLPLSVVVLTAYFVGNRFSKNVYDALIDTNGTPYMQDLPKDLYNIPVANVMIPINQSHVLALDSTYREAYKLLKAMNAMHGSMKGRGDRSVDMISQENDLTAAYHQDLHAYLRTKDSLRVEIPHIDKTKPISIKHYSPTVIPIVKTKKSMVIVGAILKEDLETSVKRLVKMIQVTHRAPIILGRYSSQDIPEPYHDHHSLSAIIPDDILSDIEDGRDSNHHPHTHNHRMNTIVSPSFTTESSPSVSNHTPFRREGERVEDTKDGEDPPTYYQYDAKDDNPITPHCSSKKRKMNGSNAVSDALSINRKILFIENEKTRDYNKKPTSLIKKSSRSDYYSQDLPTSSDIDGDEDEEQQMLEDSYMSERIQFILITHGGRKITPVALSPETYDHSASWKTIALAVPIDPSPYQIVDSMLLNKVELIFRMLSLNQAYVTNSGKLVGIINRATLREFLGKYSKRPIDKCLLLMRSITTCLFCGSGSSSGGSLWNSSSSCNTMPSSPIFTHHHLNGYQKIPSTEGMMK